MGKKQSNIANIPGNISLTPIGEENKDIPLQAKLGAQIALSREAVDVILAQKATDMLKSASIDELRMFAPKTILNEIQIVVIFMTKNLTKISTEYEDEMMKKFDQYFRRIEKKFVSFGYVLIESPEWSELADQVLKLIPLYLHGHLVNKIHSANIHDCIGWIDGIKIKDYLTEDHFHKLNLVLWDFIIKASVWLLVDNVFYSLILHGQNYEYPTEVELDPYFIISEVFREQLKFMYKNGIDNRLVLFAVEQSSQVEYFQSEVFSRVIKKLPDYKYGIGTEFLEKQMKFLREMFLAFVSNKKTKAQVCLALDKMLKEVKRVTSTVEDE